MAQGAPHPAGERGIGGTGGQPATERWDAERFRIAFPACETFSKLQTSSLRAQRSNPRAARTGPWIASSASPPRNDGEGWELWKDLASGRGNTKFDLIGVI
ncbi:hypothetical protein AB4Z01_01195 [Inquilinus sp. YAF38]|uniref:hypothetical protein n=1 Tax=Inquilinus sp. YAF38 TaxID=3233084 RepID=UPI003F8FFC99